LQLAYLADIFSKLKEFNQSTEGYSIAVITAEEKVAVVNLKLIQRVQQNKLDCFDTTNEYIEEQSKALSRCKT
jgi:hypothetical protein